MSNVDDRRARRSPGQRAARALATILCLFVLPPGCMVLSHYGGEGAAQRGSRYGSVDLAPDPSTDDAVIQVYAARAARWRGAIGVHTWVATKRTNERAYTRLEVIGYRVYWGGGAVRIREGTPDSIWFGNAPVLLRELRGDEQVDVLIDQLLYAAKIYPHDDVYHVWPGPNSNSFIAYLARAVPALRLELPSNAVGKDWLPGKRIAARTPSGTGVQVSLGGYAGVLLGLEEGVEVNLLGLTAGIDLWPPAIKLPGIGRIGFPDRRRFELRAAPSGRGPLTDPPLPPVDAPDERGEPGRSPDVTDAGSFDAARRVLARSAVDPRQSS